MSVPEAWAGFLDPSRLRDRQPEDDAASSLLAQARETEQVVEWLLEDGPGSWDGLSGLAWVEMFHSAIRTALTELDRVPLLETERKAQAMVAAEQLLVLEAALELPAMGELLARVANQLEQVARQAEVVMLRQLQQECLDLVKTLQSSQQLQGGWKRGMPDT
jgi:hypothetical protein